MAQGKRREPNPVKAVLDWFWKQVRVVIPLGEQQATALSEPLQVLPLPLTVFWQRPLPDHQAVGPDAAVESKRPFMQPHVDAPCLERQKGLSDAHLVMGAWAVDQNLDLQRAIRQHGLPAGVSSW